MSVAPPRTSASLVALQHIKRLRLPATPKYYEVWYAYASGLYPSLAKQVDEILSGTIGVTEADIDKLYFTYLSHPRSASVDELQASFSTQLERLAKAIDIASKSTQAGSESLSTARQRLDLENPDGLTDILSCLIEASKQASETRKLLQQELTTSKINIHKLNQRIEQVRVESVCDALTNVYNRKYFDESLEEHVKSKNSPFCLLMIDIDHFKQFNDRFGHQIGDEVLRLVGATLMRNFKGQDIVARYGGEEFAVILPHTSAQSAITLADHVRRELGQRNIKKRRTGESLGRVTLSIGVGAYLQNDSSTSLIDRADRALYEAKRLGRNRTHFENLKGKLAVVLSA